MIQVWLMLIVQVCYTVFMCRASPKNERVQNIVTGATQILFTLYTVLVLVVNTFAMSTYAAQTVFGMIMTVVLILIVFINVVYIIFSVFCLVRNMIRAACKNKRRSEKEKTEMIKIVQEAKVLDFHGLKPKAEKRETSDLSVVAPISKTAQGQVEAKKAKGKHVEKDATEAKPGVESRTDARQNEVRTKEHKTKKGSENGTFYS